MLNQNMISEATRLTRAGQLVEATALLQRMLRGESVLDRGSCVQRAQHRDRGDGGAGQLCGDVLGDGRET